MEDEFDAISKTSNPEAFRSVYLELRKIAAAQMASERLDHSWSPTVLVHELFLRNGSAKPESRESRKEFFGFAANAMRRLLVDHARVRAAAKRGGGRLRGTLDFEPAAKERDVDLEALDEALAELERLDPARAKLVELRFFGGHTMEECADLLDVSVATAERWWRATRAWLYARLEDCSENSEKS
jgi:RNA polymerase sigma factor (TIGR02999 family)